MRHLPPLDLRATAFPSWTPSLPWPEPYPPLGRHVPFLATAPCNPVYGEQNPVQGRGCKGGCWIALTSRTSGPLKQHGAWFPAKQTLGAGDGV